MILTVDQTKCIGCGTCISVCPDVFKLNDQGKSQVVSAEMCNKDNDCREAAESCPVQAITYRD